MVVVFKNRRGEKTFKTMKVVPSLTSPSLLFIYLPTYLFIFMATQVTLLFLYFLIRAASALFVLPIPDLFSPTARDTKAFHSNYKLLYT